MACIWAVKREQPALERLISARVGQPPKGRFGRTPDHSKRPTGHGSGERASDAETEQSPSQEAFAESSERWQLDRLKVFLRDQDAQRILGISE
jgi:hypothetical protein